MARFTKRAYHCRACRERVCFSGTDLTHAVTGFNRYESYIVVKTTELSQASLVPAPAPYHEESNGFAININQVRLTPPRSRPASAPLISSVESYLAQACRG